MVTYILGFWVVKSALYVVSVSIFDDLRYLFENVCCQPFRRDVYAYIFVLIIIFLQFFFVYSKRQVRWYSCFPTRPKSLVKNVYQSLNTFIMQNQGRIKKTVSVISRLLWMVAMNLQRLHYLLGTKLWCLASSSFWQCQPTEPSLLSWDIDCFQQQDYW